jgi:hypothetical protein
LYGFENCVRTFCEGAVIFYRSTRISSIVSYRMSSVKAKDVFSHNDHVPCIPVHCNRKVGKMLTGSFGVYDQDPAQAYVYPITF